MTKKLIIFLILVLTAIPAFAETIVDTSWVRRYNGPGNGNDGASAIAVDDSGNVCVTGTSYGSGSSNDYVTIKYFPNGDTAWVRIYNGPGNGNDGASAIAVDDSGNVYVTGASYGNGSSDDCVTIKYFPNGDTAWVRRFNGPGNNTDFGTAIAIDGSYDVYIAGGSYTGSYDDYITIKYFPNGDTAWVRMYNGSADRWDVAREIVVDDSGHIYVTGDSWGGASKEDYATVKYDPNGNQLWVRIYNGPGNGEDHAAEIAIDDSSNIYVVGQSDGGGENDDYVTIKYYPNGDTAWLRRYDSPTNLDDKAEDLALDAFGNIYVTGYSPAPGTNGDYLTIKYLPNGDTAWVRRYDGRMSYDDHAYAIAVDDSDNVYVTGVSKDSASTYNCLPNYGTIKYDQNGNDLWVEIYDGPAGCIDKPSGITVSGAGEVYVTGQSDGGGSGTDYATIKYVQSSFEPSPQVVSTSPTRNQLNVHVNTDISVTFDIDMDQTTFNDSTFVVNSWSTGLHPGTITYDSPTKTATFNPDVDFDEGEIVTVVLTTGIKSSAGTPMDSSYVWSFTTNVDDGTGCFAPPFTYITGDGTNSVFCADLDGDNDLDLAVANWVDNNVTILSNNGDGTFQSAVNYVTGYGSVSVFCADLNGDSNLDLAVANASSDNVSILINNGDGTFQSAVNFGAGSYPRSVYCADLAGDGYLDLTVANAGGNVSILINNGDGTFQDATNYGTGDLSNSVFCADLDGDYDPDLAVVNINSNNISILMNNGDGTFQSAVNYETGGSPWSVFCADLDGDSDLDLTVANYSSNNVSILKNNGDGTFQGDVIYWAGSSPYSVFCADQDGDDDLDLAVANSSSDNVSLLENNGDGTFNSAVNYGVGNGPFSVFCADLDGDADLDIATGNYYGDNVSVLLNIRRGDCSGDKVVDVGDVVFLINYLFKSGEAPVPLAVGDVSCDGVADVGDVVYLINYLFKGGLAPCC